MLQLFAGALDRTGFVQDDPARGGDLVAADDDRIAMKQGYRLSLSCSQPQRPFGGGFARKGCLVDSRVLHGKVQAQPREQFAAVREVEAKISGG